MTFLPPFPSYLVITLGVLALGILVWREYFPGRQLMHPAWFHRACLLLKIFTITILVVLLLNPSRQISIEKVESKTVILLDASASMTLAAANGRSRWDAAQKFAEDTFREICKAGLPEPEIATFSNTLNLPGVPVNPSGTKTNLATALERLLNRPGAKALDHIIIASDGRIHDRERLSGALSLARKSGVPVSAHAIGIESQIRNASLITVHAPRMVRPRSSVSIDVTLATSGFLPGEKLTLQVTNSEGSIIAETEFQSGDRASHQVLTFDSGLRTDRYELKLSSSGEPEVDLGDNRFPFIIEIATKKLRVLYAEGTHEKRPVGKDGHMWNNMEHKTRAWSATGEIEFECLAAVDNQNKFPNLVGVTFHNGEMLPDPGRDFPKTREELHDFDVLMICGIQRNNFSEEQMKWVYEWVLKRGGGFLMGGGGNSFDRGEYDKTLWERIIPVDMKSYGQGLYNVIFGIEIPEHVQKHPIWTISPDPLENHALLRTFPNFSGMNRVLRAKPGALLLALRDDGSGEPIIAAQNYGRGRSIAFLPDTNGAWGRGFLDWGPPTDPELGTFIHLGQGKDFILNEQAAVIPPGTPPGHPGSWYGQFWVNVVQWLAKDSIRWQRDKLSGRTISVLAYPGAELQVAAEVLTVSEINELLALNVGVRLDIPGSRRVRLHYDRDRREFVGALAVPDLPEEVSETRVLFDVNIDGELISQECTIGVHRGNSEFSEASPDPVFLADLARATKGTILKSAQDAVSASRKAATNREQESRNAARHEPIWMDWWIWGILGLLLCLEWTLRRRGAKASHTPALVICLIFAIPLQAEETKPIDSWIAELGADRVRLRDAADDYLRSRPEFYQNIKIAAERSENEELRIRAENIARHLKATNRWRLIATRTGHTPGKLVMNRAIVSLADHTKFFSRGRDFVREYDTKTLQPGGTFSDSNFRVPEAWLALGPVNALAISPDGKTIVSTNEYGEIIFHEVETRKEVNRFGASDVSDYVRRRIPHKRGTIYGFSFIPDDGSKLLTAERLGVRLWDIKTKQQKWRFTTKDPCLVIVMSPDQKKVLVSVDGPGNRDYVITLDTKTGRDIAQTLTPARLGGFLFDQSGEKLLTSGRDGFARIYKYDPPSGEISDPKMFGPNGNECLGVAWGKDETTILATSQYENAALTEWEVSSGKQVWIAPPIAGGFSNLTYLSENRIAVSGANGLVTIWEFTDI